MVENGNFYTFPYAQDIVNMPIANSNFEIYDETVPFLQIVLSGSISYSAAPINLASDAQLEFLRCMETGSALHFTLAYQNVDALAKAEIYDYYAVDYGKLKGQIEEMYGKAAAAYEKIGNSTIENHEALSGQVYKTTYSNGVSVIVNYADTAYDGQGIHVDGKSFACVNG